MTCIDKANCAGGDVQKIDVSATGDDIYRCKSNCDTATTLLVLLESVVCYDYDTKVTQKCAAGKIAIVHPTYGVPYGLCETIDETKVYEEY